MTDTSKTATSASERARARARPSDTTKVMNPNEDALEQKQSDKTQAKSSGKVCLTFDDGPKPKGTKEVLDVLGEKSIKATFFLTGSHKSDFVLKKDETETQEDKQGKLVRRMLAEGHKIGSHAFKHYPTTDPEYKKKYGEKGSELKTKEQQEAFEENFEQNREHFERVLGKDFPGFVLGRLPGQGTRYPGLVKAVEAIGLKHVSWDFEFGPNSTRWLLIKSWKDIKGVAATYGRFPKAGEVILFHDHHWADDNKTNLVKVVNKLEAVGLSFGLVNDSGKCA